MAEYIERDSAINAVYESFADGKSPYGALISIPAADVVPVVRCRDCIHYKPQQKSARWTSTTPMCSRSATIKMPPDGFCSFGKKREES